MLQNETPEGVFKLAPDAAGHLWTNCAETVQNVNTARHSVIVYIVLPHNS
jgi:hypothetical protein